MWHLAAETTPNSPIPTHQSTVKYFGDAFGANCKLMAHDEVDNMGGHLALFFVIVFVGAGAIC
jgi:hypothetical protein